MFVKASAHILLHGIRARGLRSSAADRHTNLFTMKNRKKGMDRRMGSSLLTEKLDRSHYALCSYKMHQYMLGHGYWSYVDGANDAAPESTQSSLLIRILCGRQAFELHSGCKDFRREHHNQKDSTQARVEQCATTRYVND